MNSDILREAVLQGDRKRENYKVLGFYVTVVKVLCKDVTVCFGDSIYE